MIGLPCQKLKEMVTATDFNTKCLRPLCLWQCCVESMPRPSSPSLTSSASAWPMRERWCLTSRRSSMWETTVNDDGHGDDDSGGVWYGRADGDGDGDGDGDEDDEGDDWIDNGSIMYMDPSIKVIFYNNRETPLFFTCSIRLSNSIFLWWYFTWRR